jgi:hypothetical protein
MMEPQRSPDPSLEVDLSGPEVGRLSPGLGGACPTDACLRADNSTGEMEGQSEQYSLGAVTDLLGDSFGIKTEFNYGTEASSPLNSRTDTVSQPKTSGANTAVHNSSYINLLISTDGNNPSVLLRPVTRLYALCQGLLDSFPLHTLLRECCQQLLLGPSTEADGFTTSVVDELFELILEDSIIVRSEHFSSFLEDADDLVARVDEVKSVDSVAGAVDFLLQSVESRQLYVPRKSSYYEDFYLHDHSTIVWKFCISGGYDIEFSAIMKVQSEQSKLQSFVPNEEDRAGEIAALNVEIDNYDCDIEILKATRVCTPLTSSLVFTQDGTCIEGSYTALTDGYCRLVFSNSYSIINGKYIEISTAVVSNDAIEVGSCRGSLFSPSLVVVKAAVLAAEDALQATRTAKSKAKL